MTDDSIVEPVALVGLACRVPGARDAAQFWDNLVSGTESIRFFTRDEQLTLGMPLDMVDHPDFVAAAPVLDDIEYFDAEFFGMSKREADVADPQHRLFLELAHTALADAGYDPARYAGSVGVYAGTGATDYLWKNVRRNPRVVAAAGNLSVNIGNNPDYVATLTSYKLNLRGPSFTLHTACSTSLVATHLAAEALRNGECDMALAGGVCIELPHGGGYIAQEGGITAPDGHCRPFDARGAGTLWGSGGGVIVLKRLADALADGDHIRAVIIANAINNDGSAKIGFSAPSVEGQTDVVAQALGLSGIDPRTVTYVEAHGTATALGDPIEVAALSRAYGQGVDEHGWCAIGSVKSNIGHLSQGAGVVGVIKTVLAMEHGLIPPSLHYESPNPAIDFEHSPFYVNVNLSTWDTDDRPRRAGISSFGIGGTNAHVILEQAPAVAPPVSPSRPVALVQVSARSEAALSTSVEQLATQLATHPTLDLADVAYTLRVGRPAYPYRAAVVATDSADAARALADRRRRHSGRAEPVAPRVAFLFSGQGSQYAGMASELCRLEPVFAEAVADCAAVLGSDPLAGDDAWLNQTQHTQPALFTVEYAMAVLLRSWGIEPTAMIGHSIGEYVAATIAGVFDLADAVRLVAARGRLMQSMPGGAMLAVQRSRDDVKAELPSGLDLAVVNGPLACVVAGPVGLVEAYAKDLAGRSVSHRMLRTSHAFHSSMMDPMLAEFAALVAAVPRRAPTIPFVSNRTGDWITAEQATDPHYWAGHVREPVLFGQSVGLLLADRDRVLVECGPGSQLTGLVRMQLPKGAPVPMSTLPGPKDRQGDLNAIYTTVGRLWVGGTDVDLEAGDARRIPLPTYPFERIFHWVEPLPEIVAAQAAPRLGRTLPMAQWCSVPVWRQLPPILEAAPLTRTLLLADGAIGAALGDQLGADVVVVGSVSSGGNGRTVRMAERDDYAALLAELVADGGIPTRIVHAWCVSERTGPSGAATVGDTVLDHSYHSLVALAQALAGFDLPAPVHLDVVTIGTREVLGGDVTRPLSAPAVGVAMVLPLELPETLTVRHIDVDEDPSSARLAATIAAEISLAPAGVHGETVALRRGRRWSPSFEPVSLPALASPAGRTGAVYLITGGLGGIGITLAEDLATTHQARLVLTSRTALPPRAEWANHRGRTDRIGRAIAAVERIESAGGEVLVLAADVTDVEHLRSVRAETLARFGQLDGIIHAAGVPGGGLVEVKTRAAAEAVLAPKVAGTLALAEAFGDLPVDVILCASITGVVGGLGQVDYAAANAFLDAYAHSGQGFTGPVTAVDWGGWLDVGMAAEVDRPEVLRAGTSGPATPVDHPILTSRHGAVDEGAGWFSGLISPSTHWVLAEHRISGVPVMPGTGHLEVARAAVAAALSRPTADSVVELRDVTFLSPMSVPDTTVAEVRVLIQPAGDDIDFEIRTGGTTHVTGTGGWVAGSPAGRVDLADLIARMGGADAITLDSAGPAAPAQRQSRSGLVSFGDRWSSLQSHRVGSGEALAQLVAPAAVADELDRWVLHPALLDEATSFVGGQDDGAYLPLGYGRITVYAPLPATLWSYVVQRGGEGVSSADIQLLDEAGTIVVDIADFMMRRIDPAAMVGTVTERSTDSTPEPQRSDAPGIRPAEGAEVLRRLLGAQLGPQVVVAVRSVDDSLASVRAVTTTTIADQSGAGVPVLREGAVDAPRTDLEARLSLIWAEVLGVSAVSREDDFFTLGGNSLVAVQLIGQVRTAVGVRLPMRSLFEASTVAAMADLIEQQQASAQANPPEADPAATSEIPRLARPQ